MAQEKKIKITQTRSTANREPGTKRTIAALGLGKIGKSRELPLNAAVEGMIKRVEHLLQIEIVK
jgi:large subunit ribosomal protein L30